MNHEHLEQWQDEFLLEYYRYSEMLPMMAEGTRPLVDLKTLVDSRYKNVWFWYPLEEFSPAFWRGFRRHCSAAGIGIHFSTAEQISETIGIPVWDREIPSIWLVALEKLTY